MVKSTQVACWLVQWGLDIRKTYLIKRPVSQRHYTYFCAKKTTKNETHPDIEKLSDPTRVENVPALLSVV